MANGALPKRRSDVDYPHSDGKPMAESDLHLSEMMALILRIRARYANRDDVYVVGNMFVYYEEGEPASCFAPDCFVSMGVPAVERRTYKLWEEKVAPSVVFEVSSKQTWLEDRGTKRALCEQLGVEEYVLYDPEAEYLRPPLQILRLVDGAYAPVKSGPDGSLECRTLGLLLSLDERGLLDLRDILTGVRLLRPEEVEQARQEAEERAASAEERAASAEERAASAESEVDSLRRELAKLRSRGGG